MSLKSKIESNKAVVGVIGLGYVHRDFTASGTNVTVLWNDARIKAVVQ